MWTLAAPYEETQGPTRIKPSRFLYYFDGPQIFQAKFGFLDAIFAKFDEHEESNLWLAAFTDDKTVDLVVNNKLSVRGAFLNGKCWVVQATESFLVERYWPCEHDDLNEEMLPEAGVALSIDAGRRPDTVEQASAFFAVGYRGEELARSHIKYSAFRSLLDNAYEVARKVLSPPELLTTRRSTFDFDIFEPKLGSLIVAIKEPLLNGERISRIGRDAPFTAQSVDAEMRLNRREFFTDVNELIQASQGDTADFEVVSEKLSTLRSLDRMLPSSRGLFQSVEFSASFDDGTASLFLDEATGRKLAEAYRSTLDQVVTEVGTIQITNSLGRSFTILTDDGRQITCKLGRREYEELRTNRHYAEGANAIVTGPVLRRPRRDLLWVNGVPLVTDRRVIT